MEGDKSKKMVEIIRDNINKLLAPKRKNLDSANEHLDEGSASLMSDYITVTEKIIWLLSAYL